MPSESNKEQELLFLITYLFLWTPGIVVVGLFFGLFADKNLPS